VFRAAADLCNKALIMQAEQLGNAFAALPTVQQLCLFGHSSQFAM